MPELELLDGVAELPRDDWNTLVGDQSPFLEWDWLRFRVGGTYSEYDASEVGFDANFTGKQWSVSNQLVANELLQVACALDDILEELRITGLRQELVGRPHASSRLAAGTRFRAAGLQAAQAGWQD